MRAVSSLFVAMLLLVRAVPARADEPEPMVDVHFTADGDRPLEIHDRTNQVTMVPVHIGRGTSLRRSYVYSPVCTATPCTAALTPGSHYLALSKPGGALVEAPAPVAVEEASSFRATYTDKSALRAAGILTSLGAAGASLALIYASTGTETHCSSSGFGQTPCTTTRTVDSGVAAAAIIVLVGGTLAGLVLACQHDEASIQVTPLALAPSSGQKEASLSSLVPNGAALTVRF